MNQTSPLFLIAVILLLSACNGSSIDGKAQEEHYHKTDSMHTIAPAVDARSYSVPEDVAGDTSKQEKTGTQTDSIRTAANPESENDKRDTGTTNH